jgi:GNAT superfamily N-acetyltransferase
MSDMAVNLRPFQAADADWVVQTHQRLYAEAEGYDATFGDLVAGIVRDFIRDFDPVGEAGWIAEADGRRLGCVFCKKIDAEVAKLRMLLVEPRARGTGLGRRLVRTCMQFARDRGYRHMTLWTHDSHKAAIAIYEAEGWKLVSSVPGVAFGVRVVDQEWVYDI